METWNYGIVIYSIAKVINSSEILFSAIFNEFGRR